MKECKLPLGAYVKVYSPSQSREVVKYLKATGCKNPSNNLGTSGSSIGRTLNNEIEYVEDVKADSFTSSVSYEEFEQLIQASSNNIVETYLIF